MDMRPIAIAVNPMAGTDVRRFVTQASGTGAARKAEIAVRALAAANKIGAREFLLMPDRDGLAEQIQRKLNALGVCVEIADTCHTGEERDTVEFVRYAKNRGSGCVILMGGDGTSRAAANVIGDTPLLPISAGTNNVYPYYTEGTAAGIAAAGIASGRLNLDEVCIRDKRIEIWWNGQMKNIALVDAAVSDDPLTGSKNISPEEISEIIVTRCHPASIGFSAIVGCRCQVTDREPYGAALRLRTGERFIAPVSSGFLRELVGDQPQRLGFNKTLEITADFSGSVALDGERTVVFRKGDHLAFKVRQNGPLRILYHEVCARMQELGMYLLES